MDTETIGQRIRRLRLAKQIRFQKDFAKMIEIDPASLNQIEQGYRVPKLSTVDRMAIALGVSRNVILDGESAARAMPSRPSDAEPETASEQPVTTTRPRRNAAYTTDKLAPDLLALIRTTVQEEIRSAIIDLGFAITGSARAAQSATHARRQGARSNAHGR